ncbi:MAG TPA: SDR family oxidoreductase [Pyrinomonadaceae bacterium]|nr:SDR family oxidoreductase [Pyrinomonadaceae bacterium]
MSRFNGKVAVITGGNSGIGLATAKELATNGAKVVIAGRDQKTLDETVQCIGENAFAVKTDVTNLDEITNLFEQTNHKFGKVDILFVNAGIGKFASVEQSDESLFDEIVSINLKGSYFTVKNGLQYLNDGASIVFTTTVAAKKGLAGASVYGAAKSALHSLTKIFAAELVGRKIRVNAVSPGPIETPIFGRMGIPAENQQMTKDALASQVPMKRLGTAEEVAKTVAFLASDDSSYITGIEIDVDGGMGQL